MRLNRFQNATVLIAVLTAVGVLLLCPVAALAEEPIERFDLKQTIETAIKVNLELQRSKEEVKAAQATKNARTTEFLPTLNATYGYIHRDNPTTQAIGTAQGQIIDVLVNPDEEYNFVTSFFLNLFSGVLP